MIKLEPSPGNSSLDVEPSHIATIQHGPDNSVGVGIHWYWQSKLPIRRYLAGLEPPNYPVPAIPLHVEFYHGYWGPYVALFQVLEEDKDWRHLRRLKTWR